MAKKSSIEKNARRRRLVKKYAAKRLALLAIANDESKQMEERFEARLRLAQIPRREDIQQLAQIRNQMVRRETGRRFCASRLAGIAQDSSRAD